EFLSGWLMCCFVSPPPTLSLSLSLSLSFSRSLKGGCDYAIPVLSQFLKRQGLMSIIHAVALWQEGAEEVCAGIWEIATTKASGCVCVRVCVWGCECCVGRA